MKKIGKEVAFLHTNATNSRNGEGSFIRLLDGRIMYAYTEYYGGSWKDHATARISAIYSSDEGEHWTKPSVLIEKDADQSNIMSVSLVRLPNGGLGVLYLAKHALDERHFDCMPLFRYSFDEGKTFSEAIPLITERGYYIINNDRIYVTRSGRILAPCAHSGSSIYTVSDILDAATIRIFYSDDNGLTWGILPGTLYFKYADGIGLQEPGIVELDDGTLWVYCRTPYGYQHQAFSRDGGVTFSAVTPNFYFTSPDSPMLIKRLSRGTVAIFNPCGYNCTLERYEDWGAPRRTPYVLAVTPGDGSAFNSDGIPSVRHEFKKFTACCYYVEDDIGESYCYPAILETKDGFLVAYYHSDGTGICLKSGKITKIHFEEIGL